MTKYLLGGGVEEIDLTLGAIPDAQYSNFVNLKWKYEYYGTVNIGWSRDRRDSAIIPSAGTFNGFNRLLLRLLVI